MQTSIFIKALEETIESTDMIKDPVFRVLMEHVHEVLLNLANSVESDLKQLDKRLSDVEQSK